MTIDSDVLRGNRLGDPHVRPLWVYLPPGYDDAPDRRYPEHLRDPGPDRPDRHVVHRAALRPTVPSVWTSCSRARRDAAGVLVLRGLLDIARRQPVPRLPGHRPLPDVPVRRGGAVHRRAVPRPCRPASTAASPASRAAGTGPWWPRCCGRTPSAAWPATPATPCSRHCYLPDMAAATRALREHYDGSYERFFADFAGRPAMSQAEADGVLLGIWAMAACYSAEADGTVTLPFDPATGRLRDEVWAALAGPRPGPHGRRPRRPVRRSLRGDLPGRRPPATSTGSTSARPRSRPSSTASGSEHVSFELFDATHSAIEYRYPGPASPSWPSACRRDGRLQNAVERPQVLGADRRRACGHEVVEVEQSGRACGQPN